MSNGSSLAFKNSGLKVKTSEILTVLEFYLISLIYKPQILDLKTDDSASTLQYINCLQYKGFP